MTKEAKAEEAKIVSLADSKKSKLIQFQQKIASNKDLMQKYQDRIDYYDTASNKPSGGNAGNSSSSGSSRPGAVLREAPADHPPEITVPGADLLH